MKSLMNKDVCVFFMCNEDKKLIINYSKEEDINKSGYNKIIQIQTRILISGTLAFFATVVNKMNMSGCWCHWSNVSAKEWSDKSHTKEILWTVDLFKTSLKDKNINKNMTSYERK